MDSLLARGLTAAGVYHLSTLIASSTTRTPSHYDSRPSSTEYGVGNGTVLPHASGNELPGL